MIYLIPIIIIIIKLFILRIQPFQISKWEWNEFDLLGFKIVYCSYY